MTARTYGWKRDLPDFRDHAHAPKLAAAAPLPRQHDESTLFPVAYDQGDLGSCTANAGAALVQRLRRKQSQGTILSELNSWTPSRLAIYYQERAIDPYCLVSEDSGATIRDCAKVLSKYGAAPEAMWPYDTSRFTKRPPKSVYTEALKHRALAYAKVPQTHDAIRRTLAGGDPIMFGFSVYDSFESDFVARNGVVPMPQQSEDLLGGHAVCLVGYDDDTRLYHVRNSWGAGWGQSGYCWMPYEYVESANLASDFWVISAEEA